MMSAKYACVLVALSVCLVQLGSAQVLFDGACPAGVQVQPNFTLEAYLGTWYEYAKYPVYFELDGKCVTAQYSLNADGIVNVKNSMIDEETKQPVDILGTATVAANAKLIVDFPTSAQPTPITSNYWVLSTDYDSYSVVYSCQPITDDKHYTIVWILTRERQPSKELVAKAEKILTENNISLKQLMATDQQNC